MQQYELFKDAIKNSVNHNYDSAIRQFEYVLKCNPNDPLVEFEYARTLIKCIKIYSKNPVWEKKCRELLERSLESKRNLNAIYELGNLEFGLGNFTEAKKNYLKVIRNYRNRKNQIKAEYNIYKYALRGMVLFNKDAGEIEEAYRYLDELIALEENTEDREDNLFLKCRILFREGKYDEALILCDSLKNTKKEFSDFEKGRILIEQGKYLEGVSILKQFIKNSNNHFFILAYQKIIGVYLKLDMLDEAKKLLDEFVMISGFSFKYNYVIDSYIKYKDGVDKRKIDRTDTSYSVNMLLDYNEDELIKHIKNKHSSELYYPVEELLDKCRNKLNEEHRVHLSDLMEEHLIEFDYPVGKSFGLDTKTLGVITFPNDNRIITLYPSADIKKKDNVEVKEIEKPKQLKKQSRIDWFNKKYNLNTSK